MGRAKTSIDSPYCACCNKEFSKGVRKTKKFLATGLSGLNALDEFHTKNVEVTVCVSTAVEEILSWKCDKSVFPGLVDSNLAMCSTCGIILAKLYTAVKVFQEVKSEISSLSNISKRLVKGEQASKSTDTDEDKQYEEAYVEVWGADDMVSTDPDHFVDVEEYPLPTRADWETAGPGGVRNPYSRHRKHSKDNTMKEFPCPNCSAGFDKSANLTRHLLLTHEVGDRSKDFHCSFCGKAYYFDYQLKNHMKIHGSARPFGCTFPNCSAAFKVKRGLQVHLKVKHREGLPFKCRFCKKAFKDERYRINHETFVHTMPGNAKPHVCPDCDKRFKRISSMHGHIRHKKCTLKRQAILAKFNSDEQHTAIDSILQNDIEVVTTIE